MLDEPVSSERLLGAAYAVHGKGTITVRNLLLHNAGREKEKVRERESVRERELKRK